MQENVIYILKGLLTDVSLSIQQNAAIAVGKLASHSAEIAELLDKEEVLRTLIYVNIERPHVMSMQKFLFALTMSLHLITSTIFRLHNFVTPIFLSFRKLRITFLAALLETSYLEFFAVSRET